jgi:hypothetical protein
VALTNRANDPEPSAQLAWKKCEADGLIVSRLGVLDNELAKVWQPDQAHVAVRQLRDWFAQYPYLSKLRDPQVLAKAISEALARADAKYAIADRFDEAKGEYDQAEPLYRRAMEIFQTKLGLHHPNTVTVRKNYDRLQELKKQNPGKPAR